jgi:hypothetical protein
MIPGETATQPWLSVSSMLATASAGCRTLALALRNSAKTFVPFVSTNGRATFFE